MRERLRGKFIHALSNLGMELETQGDAQAAAECYLRGIEADPVVESSYQGLMRCYEKLGRRSEAFSAFRRLKQTLSVVLGVPPSGTTQKLFERLLENQREGVASSSGDADVAEPQTDARHPSETRDRLSGYPERAPQTSTLKEETR